MIDPLQMRVSPADLERAAEHCTILATCLQAWRQGVMSYEVALLHAVFYLADQNKDLMQSAVKLERMKLPGPIEHNGKRYLYCGPCPLCGQKINPVQKEK
jgi:hypothetical protein